MRKKISIVVPCYNEDANINRFYKRINKVSKDIDSDFEIIFVDDGSCDDTLEIIKDLALKDEKIRYISFSRNFGKEAAMLAGLKYATGVYITIMDADLQDPPELIKNMYEVLESTDYDCCALYTSNHEDYSFFRKKFTNCWYKLFELISSTKQMRGARDCRLMRRKMVAAILSMSEYNRYTKGIFSYIGFKTFWIEYDIPQRQKGTSKFSIIKLFKYALEAIIAFSTTPLVVSAFVGILFCLISFIAIIVIICKTVIFGDPVSGWPSIACIIIFVGGLQLFFLGVIGMYLSKMYLEVKNRPIYIVRETEKDL